MEYYVAIDGDDIGRSLEKRILSNNEIQVGEYSDHVRNIFERLKDAALHNDLFLILFAGDSLITKGREDQTLRFLSQAIVLSNELKFSVGLSDNLKGAYFALKEAKGLGRYQIVFNFNSNSESFSLSEIKNENENSIFNLLSNILHSVLC